MPGRLSREDKSPLGRAIQDLGLTVRDAATICGLHHKTMEGYCKPSHRTGSRRPSPDVLNLICKRLKLDARQFEAGGEQRNIAYIKPEHVL